MCNCKADKKTIEVTCATKETWNIWNLWYSHCLFILLASTSQLFCFYYSTTINEQSKPRDLNLQHLSYITCTQLAFHRHVRQSSKWWERWAELDLPHTGRHWTCLTLHGCDSWTLSVSPNRRIHASQARCSTALSLPTFSLLAPAKTFEVFGQRGNTFAFHLTCLWRPLKYIIAEQHRSPSHPP